MEENTREIRAKDGRRLAFCEYGPATGSAVLFCQGTPSSRLTHPDTAITQELGARLIVIDRPGFGRSDPQPGRRIADIATDAATVMDALGLAQFAVIGISGGGPFAAAVAQALPDRVTQAALTGSTGPLDGPGNFAGMTPVRRMGYLIARHAPRLMPAAIHLTNDPRRGAERFFSAYTRHNPPADQAILARTEIRDMFLRSYRESCRQGIQAFAEEVCLGAGDWGFPLEEIRCPVDIWHGEADNSTPPAMARHLAARIPGARLHLLPGQGHVFVYGELWREVLASLLDPRP
jgi:pimeloyl-ACP methyl ester carboxylesterase